MIEPLCVATRGLITGEPFAIATRGYICQVTAIVVSGGYVSARTIKLPERDLDKIPFERLVQEDEELIALIVMAISEGIIP